jgi:hypothetical protein
MLSVEVSRAGWLALTHDSLDRDPDIARAILFRRDIFSVYLKLLDLSLAFGDVTAFGLFT